MQEFITEKELEARAKQVIAPIPMPSGKIEYHKVSHESVFSYRAMIEVGIKEETLVAVCTGISHGRLTLMPKSIQNSLSNSCCSFSFTCLSEQDFLICNIIRNYVGTNSSANK